jgi:ligand-binding sensor domain-containing protein
MKNVITFSIVLMSVVLLASTFSYSQNFWQKQVSLSSAVNQIAINSNGDLFVITNGKGLQRSTDEGLSWTRIDTVAGMKNNYYSIYIDKNNNIFAGSYLGQGYRSTDNGASWTKFYLGDSTALVTAFAVDKQGKIYAGTSGYGIHDTTKNGLFTSTNNGATWDTLENTLYPIPVIYPYITSITIDSRENIFVGTYGAGLYKSTNRGATWVKDGSEYWRITGLAAAANGRLFVGTDNGVYYDSLEVDTTKNESGIVTRLDTIRSGWQESGHYIFRIDTVYIIKQDTTVIAGDPPRDSVYADTTIRYDTTTYHNQWHILSMAATSGGHLYAASAFPGRRIVQSTDNGLNWNPLYSGMTDTIVTSVLLNPKTGYLYMGTQSGTFYRSTSPDLTNTPPEESQTTLKPAAAILEQNYPNPFNPTTSIPFVLRENSYTSLIIYDILGKEVARLVDGMVTAGRHEVRWDASSVSSGVYFYRLQTSMAIKTGKLTLIK